MIRGNGGMPSGLPELCLDPIDGSTFPAAKALKACGVRAGAVRTVEVPVVWFMELAACPHRLLSRRSAVAEVKRRLRSGFLRRRDRCWSVTWSHCPNNLPREAVGESMHEGGRGSTTGVEVWWEMVSMPHLDPTVSLASLQKK